MHHQLLLLNIETRRTEMVLLKETDKLLREMDLLLSYEPIPDLAAAPAYTGEGLSLWGDLNMPIGWDEHDWLRSQLEENPEYQPERWQSSPSLMCKSSCINDVIDDLTQSMFFTTTSSKMTVRRNMEVFPDLYPDGLYTQADIF